MCMTFACGCVTTNTIEQTNQVWRDSTWATEQTTSHHTETHHHHTDENTSFDDHVPTQNGHTHQVQKPTEHLKHHCGDKSQVDAMHQQTTVKTSNELKLSERTLAFRRTTHKTPRCKPPCDVRTTMYHCQTPGTTNSPTRSTKTRTQHVSFTWNVDVDKHTHTHERKIYSPQYTNSLNQATPRSKQVTTNTPIVSAHDTNTSYTAPTLAQPCVRASHLQMDR